MIDWSLYFFKQTFMVSTGGETVFDFANFENELVGLNRSFSEVPDLAESCVPEMYREAFPGMTEKEWRGYFKSDAEAQAALESASTKRQVAALAIGGMKFAGDLMDLRNEGAAKIAELIAEAILSTGEDPRVTEIVARVLQNQPDEVQMEIWTRVQTAYAG